MGTTPHIELKANNTGHIVFTLLKNFHQHYSQVLDNENNIYKHYPTRRKFSLEFKFRYFANSLNLNSTINYIIRNLSMIAYVIEIQKSKFASIQSLGFGQFEPDC